MKMRSYLMSNCDCNSKNERNKERECKLETLFSENSTVKKSIQYYQIFTRRKENNKNLRENVFLSFLWNFECQAPLLLKPIVEIKYYK